VTAIPGGNTRLISLLILWGNISPSLRLDEICFHGVTTDPQLYVLCVWERSVTE